MTTVNNDPYIMIRDDVFAKDFCNHCIKKFDKDNRSVTGAVGHGIDLDVKLSQDLNITVLPDWQEENNVFSEVAQMCVFEYTQHCNDKNPLPFTVNPLAIQNEDGVIGDTGFQIQRTNPGPVGYSWHNDAYFNLQSAREVKGNRTVTFIFYLNTVDEGWTQFYNGDQVAPVQGRVLCFPSTWTYCHQGYPPKQTKYICIAFVCELLKQ